MVPGQGLLACHVNDHILAGMAALYTVSDAGLMRAQESGKARVYWVQAEVVDW
jgi:hypothetical protein